MKRKLPVQGAIRKMKKRNQKRERESRATIFDVIPVDEPWFWIGVVLTASIFGVLLTLLKIRGLL